MGNSFAKRESMKETTYISPGSYSHSFIAFLQSYIFIMKKITDIILIPFFLSVNPYRLPDCHILDTPPYPFNYQSFFSMISYTSTAPFSTGWLSCFTVENPSLS